MPMSLWTMSWGWKRYWHSSWRPCTKKSETNRKWIRCILNPASIHLQIDWAMKYRIATKHMCTCISWYGNICGRRATSTESLMITSNGGKLSLHLHRFWWFAVWYFSCPTAQQLPPQTLKKKIKHYCHFYTWWIIQIKDFELSSSISEQVERRSNQLLAFINSPLHLHLFIKKTRLCKVT